MNNNQPPTEGNTVIYDGEMKGLDAGSIGVLKSVYFSASGEKRGVIEYPQNLHTNKVHGHSAPINKIKPA